MQLQLLLVWFFFRYTGRDCPWIIICVRGPWIWREQVSIISGSWLFFPSCLQHSRSFSGKFLRCNLVLSHRFCGSSLWSYYGLPGGVPALGVFPDITRKGYGNFFGFANTEVLLTGDRPAFAILIRTYVEGPMWIRWYITVHLYRKLSENKQ